MKVLIKKTYCSSCQRLVTGREQKANSTAKIVCSRCGKALWVGDSMTWRKAPDST